MSQVHVALDIFYQHIVHVYWGVVYNHHLCLCDVHLKTHSHISSDSSCSICCSSCGVAVHRNMSSAKRGLERNSPSIFTPLCSQFNLLNMLSNVAVNSLGEMVSPCLTPLLILIFSLSLCRCTVSELSVYMNSSLQFAPCGCMHMQIWNIRFFYRFNRSVPCLHIDHRVRELLRKAMQFVFRQVHGTF